MKEHSKVGDFGQGNKKILEITTVYYTLNITLKTKLNEFNKKEVLKCVTNASLFMTLTFINVIVITKFNKLLSFSF